MFQKWELRILDTMVIFATVALITMIQMAHCGP